MRKTLKVLSALLTYPTHDLQMAAEALKSALTSESVLPKAQMASVIALIDDIATGDLYDVQERYVLLFDRTRSLSLNLFEHVHGESRDRGQAMVDLLTVYRAGGYEPEASELPDFLPLFLEYASTRGAADAQALVSEPGHVLAALDRRLSKRASPYAAVFGALVALANVRLSRADMEALDREPDPEADDLEALDAAWEEEEVRFGPGSAEDCGRDELVAKMRQAVRPAPGLEKAPASGPWTVVTHSRSSNT